MVKTATLSGGGARGVLALVLAAAFLGTAAPAEAAGGGPAPMAGGSDDPVDVERVEHAAELAEECAEYQQHPPIQITEEHGEFGLTWTNPATGEDEVRPGSGVVGGDGSAEDPYVIEGWCVSTAPAPPVEFPLGPDPLPGILVQGTESYVVVRGNIVLGSVGLLAWTADWADGEIPGSGYGNLLHTQIGISLRGVANVAVEGNTVGLAGIGIRVGQSRDVLVAGNTAAVNAAVGVYAVDAVDVALHGNTVTLNRLDGIDLLRGEGLVVEGNTSARNDRDGLLVRGGAEGVLARNNLFAGNGRYGVRLPAPGEDVRLEANEVTENRVGISMPEEAPGVVLRGNNVHANTNGVGLSHDAHALSELDARANWWGCAAGPGAEDCDRVNGVVTYTPWLTEANPGAGPHHDDGSEDVGVSADEQSVQRADDCNGREEHPPIRIAENDGPQGFVLTNPLTGESDHRPGSGVVAGDGSKDDPFVIEGWCITALPGRSPVARTGAIAIHETDAHVVVRDNTILSDTGELTLNEYAVYLSYARNVTIVDNTVTGADYGIWVLDGRGVTVEGNTVTGSARTGIRLGAGNGVVIRGNTAVDNGNHGIRAGNASNVTIEGNTATGNAGAGIYVTTVTGAVVEDNVSADNSGVGVVIFSGAVGAVVRDNTITDNADVGVWVSQFLVSHPRNTHILGNEIAGNRIGVMVSGQAPGTFLHDNNLTGHRDGVGLTAEHSQDAVDARENWWGCPDGPGAPGCEEVVVGERPVSYAPWLTEPHASAGADARS